MVPVTHRFIGHKGVIFSIKWLSETLLLSVSDDRTTKLWSTSSPESALLTFIGHFARVWDAIYIPSHSIIASVSEDTTCKLFRVDLSSSNG